MAKKKVKAEGALPPGKVELLAQAIYNHYMRARETGLYCIIDRTRGFHFLEVVKDGVWSYTGNGRNFDSVIVIERLYIKDKCKVVKYPVYETSEEAMRIYEEFAKFSSQDITKETFEGNNIDERSIKMQEYIDKMNAIPPTIKEVDQLAYIDGYNTDLGFPVIALDEMPAEMLREISFKLAEYALSHFSTMSFLYDDDFVMGAEPVVVDPEMFNDIIVTFTTNGPLVNRI